MADLDFFAMAQESAGGEKFRGYKPKHEDPLVRAKANFITGIDAQVEMIKTGVGAKVNRQGNQSGNMFEKLPSGVYRITLKNGISPLKIIAGKEYFDMPNADKAVEFLAAAAVASEAGKFDEQFKESFRKVKPKGKSTVANVIDSIKTKSNGVSAV